VKDRPDAEVDRSHGGYLGLQVSNAIGRLHKELVGRGPDKVRTVIDEDLVVCLLEGGFTQAERTLQAQVGDGPVADLRRQLQGAMRAAIVETVKAILGREVRSFMSANDPSRDLQVEVIVLGGDVASEPTAASEELAERRKHALDATRSLREDQAALMAEQAQASRSLRRRAERLPER
jgi:uncharacterized protein YbcI